MNNRLARCFEPCRSALTIATLTLFIAGCENDSSPDGKTFAISPAKTTLTMPNQTASLTVTGGDEPFAWSVSDTTLGAVSGSGRTVTYTRAGAANGVNTVKVNDKRTWLASAAISQTDQEKTLAVTPSTANLAANGDITVFTAGGGLAPYSWSVGNAAAGKVDVKGSSQATYTRTGSGNNSVTLTDKRGHVAIAQITQPTMAVTALTLTASSTKLDEDFDLATLEASGGVPPYSWSVLNATLGRPNMLSGAVVIYSRDRAGNNVVTVKDSAGTEKIVIIEQP